MSSLGRILPVLPKVFLKTGIRDWLGWSLLFPFFPILLAIQNRAVPQRSWLFHALSDGIMPLKHPVPAWLSCKKESMYVLPACQSTNMPGQGLLTQC